MREAVTDQRVRQAYGFHERNREEAQVRSRRCQESIKGLVRHGGRNKKLHIENGFGDGVPPQLIGKSPEDEADL